MPHDASGGDRDDRTDPRRREAGEGLLDLGLALHRRWDQTHSR